MRRMQECHQLWGLTNCIRPGLLTPSNRDSPLVSFHSLLADRDNSDPYYS